jgi:hypothetical protein
MRAVRILASLIGSSRPGDFWPPLHASREWRFATPSPTPDPWACIGYVLYRDGAEFISLVTVMSLLRSSP